MLSARGIAVQAPSRQHLSRRARDTFCYELTATDFQELFRISDAFRDFCTRRIANLLEQSKQVLQAQYAKSTSDQQSMSSPLASLIRRAPVSCSPETPLREVLETMYKMGIGSMVAVDEQKKPVGVFTLHDVLNRVTLPGIALDVPFKTVMSPNPRTLPPHAMAHDAALVMAKYGFRHILIEENGVLKGLISEKDLFSLQRVRPTADRQHDPQCSGTGNPEALGAGHPATGRQHACAGHRRRTTDPDHLDPE